MSHHPSNLNLSHYAQTHRDVVLNYCQLSMQPQLSEQDAERLDAILAVAQTDPLLSLLIDEADHMVAHLYNFIDEREIADQQQKLQTCLSEVWLNEAFQDLSSRLKASQCKSLQMYLQAEGFYRGAVDGVMGPVTKAAMRACCELKGELPQPLPIHTPEPANC